VGKNLLAECWGQGRALGLWALPSAFSSLTSAAGDVPGDGQPNPGDHHEVGNVLRFGGGL